ncbi:hypothetical protein [Mycobacterium paraffinicum]|uniref:hypothetical protein n=1 Tax=Mycobacterium paraffinicum TaxID=53378 RepID=UPI00093BD126
MGFRDHTYNGSGLHCSHNCASQVSMRAYRQRQARSMSRSRCNHRASDNLCSARGGMNYECRARVVGDRMGSHRLVFAFSSNRRSRRPVGICSIHCSSEPGTGRV